MQLVYDYLIIFFSWLPILVLEYPRAIILPLIVQRNRVRYREDRSSVWAILILDNLAWLVAVGTLIAGTGMLPFAFVYLGVAMMAFGIALRQWSISALGPFWAPTVRIIKRHKVITAGPYKHIRHPSYTGAFLYFFGMCLVARSPAAIAAVAIILLPAYIYRIRVEERSLSKHVRGYRTYVKMTRMLVPFVF